MSDKIKILDEETITKIAAGEIIERPASVVKELVENSIDASSQNIIVEIKGGGKDYIRVTDDGTGIDENQVELAFIRHSTSKISNIDDLNNIYSLGFRGEALASISMVSKVETITRTRNSTKGIRVFIDNGKIVDKQVIGCPIGTSMILRELFYNVPVRRKFLKQETAEANYVSDILYKLALGNPNISFKYIKDDKLILKTPGTNDIVSNIYSILGKEFIDNLLELNYKDSNLKIKGYISKNSFYRGNRRHQYIFVNKRWVKNYEITKTIEDCYKSMIPINKFPIFILFIDIDPSNIDVNIHPTKEEVKFVDQFRINELINILVRENIDKVVTIPKVEIIPLKMPNVQPINFLDKNYLEDDTDKFSNVNDEFKEMKIMSREESNQEYLAVQNDLCKNDLYECDSNLKLTQILNDVKIVGVLFNTYIILENTSNDNFYILDQHAAHERIMYEQYKKEYEDEKVVTQKLILPEVIDLTNDERELVKENKDLFYRLGFEIEEFGINSLAIRGVPLIFGVPKPKELFFDILDNIKSNIKSSYDVKLEKIMKIACTNAIKGGDRIANIEIEELLAQLVKTENPYTCPHGRPTIIDISRQELEKRFKRII
ncbi:MAG: DNA mismatch repair protein MutL [Sporanaerobacter sp.]|jgi:DNA mismatch repair protein MutL|uniref:DNA mismatch repair endonuclease MutL n=1 Tax=Sporanaerobacter sp. TaxID=2010183 RepID=UPI003A101D1A